MGSTNGHFIHFFTITNGHNEWFLRDNSKPGKVLYYVGSTAGADVPPTEGWKETEIGQDPAPTLKYVPNVPYELALRKILQMDTPEIPRSDMMGWVFMDQTVLPWGWGTKLGGNRRRLMSDAAGYGPHDHASTQRHIRRLLASEAVASGSA